MSCEKETKQAKEESKKQGASTVSIDIDSASLRTTEINTFRNIAAAIPTGTYLKDLFSDKMACWVEEQIKNDFPPDLMDALDYIEKQLRKSESKSQSLLRDAAIAKRELERQVKPLKAELKRTKSDNSKLKERAQKTAEEFANVKLDNFHTHVKLTQSANTIEKLKIRLYDLEHPHDVSSQ